MTKLPCNVVVTFFIYFIQDSSSDNDGEDLLQGDLDKESDATDSEHEDVDPGSDGERDVSFTHAF